MASPVQNFKVRIASLSPSVTSILVALGARRKLVAVSKWCKEVADVDGLPEFGDCWSPGSGKSAAELMELKPTMIIGSVPFRAETVRKILELPVPFLALNPRVLADIEVDIRTLGSIAGASARAEFLIRTMRRKFERIRKIAARTKAKPRVYCEAWPNPRISSPPWVAELVEIAGGRMVVGAGKRVTDPEVAESNPEIIVLAWAATGGKSKPEPALRNPAWRNVSAVCEGRVFVVRDELLNTPGPPLTRGAEELLRVIHPEIAAQHESRERVSKRERK